MPRMVKPSVQISRRKVICDDVEGRSQEEDSGSSDGEEELVVQNDVEPMHDVDVPRSLSDSDDKYDDREEEEMLVEEEGGEPALDDTWMESENYEIGPTGNMRRKPKRQRLSTGKVVLPDNIRNLLGDAHLAYMANDLANAIYLLGECIRQAPHVPNAYRTLALIYEEKEHNRERALGLYTIVASLEPKNLEVQQKTARLALELGNLEVALDCLKRATILNPNNISMALEKAWLFTEIGKTRRAVNDLKKLLQTNQHNIDLYFVLAEVAEKNIAFHSTALQAYALCLRYVLGQQVYLRQGMKDICDSVDWIDPLPERDTLDIPNSEVAFSVGISLARSLIDDKKYDVAKDAITSIVQWLQAARFQLREKEAAAMSSDVENGDGPTSAELMLPMDLAVHMGVCHIYLGEFTEGRGCFGVLMRQNPGEEPYGSMLLEAAQPFIAQEKFDDAIIFLGRVSDSDSCHKVKALRLVAECWVDKGNIPKAMEVYTNALDIEPYDCATLISLSRNAVQLKLEECTIIAYQYLKPMAERIVLQFASDNKCYHGTQDVREEDWVEDGPDATVTLAEENSWTTLELLMEWGKLTLARNYKDIGDVLYTHLPVVETFVLQVANSGRAPNYLQNPTLAEYDCFVKREGQSPWHESLDQTAQCLAAKLDIGSDVSPETIQDILHSIITVLVLNDRIADARSVLEAASRYRAVMSLAVKRQLQNIVDGSILYEVPSLTSSASVGGSTQAGIFPSTSQIRSRRRLISRGAAAERRDVFQDAFNDLDKDPDNLEHWLKVVDTLGNISTTKRRRIIKLVEAHSEKAAAHLLQGNDAMCRGSYKFAYCSYSKAVSLSPRIDSNKAVEDPLECAFKAVSAIQESSNILAEECKEMNVATPPEPLKLWECVVGHSIVEEMYNIGRIYHQIRILHLAEHFYRKAVEYTNDDGSPLLPEAAFNLMALYKEVGSVEMAYDVMLKFLTIGNDVDHNRNQKEQVVV